MTRRDQKLLDRQLRALCVPQRSDGMIMLTIATLVVGGLFLGNLHAPKPAISDLQAAIATATATDSTGEVSQ